MNEEQEAISFNRSEAMLILRNALSIGFLRAVICERNFLADCSRKHDPRSKMPHQLKPKPLKLIAAAHRPTA
jgi:hypothetical protein